MRRSNRRGILVLAGSAAGLIALPRLWARLRPLPGATPHPDVPGFYVLDAGPVTSSADPFIGLDAPGDTIPAARIDAPCAALFAQPIPAGRVPVAFFTDINCSYCREMEPHIAALPADKAAVTWHDLPLLGPASVIGARAIAAASLQGMGAALRQRMTRSRVQPDPSYLATLAEAAGLDADRLLADMNGPEVTAQLSTTMGLAALFGIYGTPALVVGRTLAIGARPMAQIEAMIAETPPGPTACP